MFAFIKEKYSGSEDSILDFNEAFTEAEVGRITKMKISRMQLSENGKDVLDESIHSLKESMAKKAAEGTNSIEGLNELLEKIRKD